MRNITTRISAADLAADTQHLVTHVAPVEDLSVQVPPGGDRPQLRDADTGMPMWELGILRRFDRWGKPDTEIIKVRVGAPEQPPADGMVTFAGLGVTLKVDGTAQRRRDGETTVRLMETTYWSAEQVTAVEAGRRSGGRQADGGDA